MDLSAVVEWITRHQQVITWLAGGAATAAGGAWVAIRYVLERPASRPAEPRPAGTNVSATGSGIAAARDVRIEGGVTVTHAMLPRGGIALVLVGMALIALAILRGGTTTNVRNGAVIGGDMTNSSITVAPATTVRP
jgi:hypothetical protein